MKFHARGNDWLLNICGKASVKNEDAPRSNIFKEIDDSLCHHLYRASYNSSSLFGVRPFDGRESGQRRTMAMAKMIGIDASFGRCHDMMAARSSLWPPTIE